MSRILAIDWDGVEARFAFGNVLKDRLIVLSSGAADIAVAADEIADAATQENVDVSENTEQTNPADEENQKADEDVQPEVVESATPVIPVAYDDEEDEEHADGGVVVSVKKSKRESFKTSPLAFTLKKLLKENKVGKAVVCYALERGDVDVMYLTIPQTSDAETPEIVFNQALRDSLTFNENQPLDYMPLGVSNMKRSGVRRVAAASIARDKLRRIRETLAGAVHAPAKIELREPSIAEFVRADFCSLKYDEPVILIQELCDEVNLALCLQKDVLYFRSFKLQVEASPVYRAERIREEVVRTLVVGVDDLPENAEVNQAVFFTGETKPSQDDLYEEDGSQKVSPNVDTTATRLAALLVESGINVDFIDPFRLPGVKLKTTEPDNPGRYASVLGMILAERPQCKPSIDLLHPHEKPKPPNYALVFVLYFILVASAAFWAWRWNKQDIERLNGELTKLTAEQEAVSAELRAKQPLYATLSSANNWQNVQGVNVLDELRDIITRLPQQPNFIVQRLGYSGAINGRPTFIISAKITSLDYFQIFRNNMQFGGAHMVVSAQGAVPNVGDSGYKYMFSANIICSRRAPNTYLAVQPQEIQQISNNMPEYFVQKEKERQEEIKKQQEKLLADALKVFESVDELTERGKTIGRTEGEEREQTSVDNGLAYCNELKQKKAEIDSARDHIVQAFNGGNITKVQFEAFKAEYQKNAENLVKTYQVVLQSVNAKQAKIQAAEKEKAEAKAAEEAQANQTAEQSKEGEQAVAQNGQNPQQNAQNQDSDLQKQRYEFWKEKDGNNTTEQDSALAPQLLQYRKNIDMSMRQAQMALQQGNINQQTFMNTRNAYVQNVVDVEARWKVLQERIEARNKTPEPAPATPEPAPATPEPAPATPEPAPATPEPTPATAQLNLGSSCLQVV